MVFLSDNGELYIEQETTAPPTAELKAPLVFTNLKFPSFGISYWDQEPITQSSLLYYEIVQYTRQSSSS